MHGAARPTKKKEEKKITRKRGERHHLERTCLSVGCHPYRNDSALLYSSQKCIMRGEKSKRLHKLFFQRAVPPQYKLNPESFFVPHLLSQKKKTGIRVSGECHLSQPFCSSRKLEASFSCVLFPRCFELD